MRKSSVLIDKLEEFNKNGFIEISRNGNVLKALRREYSQYYRVFKSVNKSKGINVKYGTYDLFGDILNYYYDIRHKDKFVSFLEKKFREYNDDYDTNVGKRGAFTRLLHMHSLDAQTNR